jgi:hypothetical protein
MKNILFPLFIPALSILIASCDEKVELKYTKEELYLKAVKIDPDIKFILPKSMSEGASCQNYSKNCVSAHFVRVQNLDLIAVEFMTEKDAVFAAKKYRGLYLRNWMFDDVIGEPILEKFMIEKLEVKRP